MVFAWSHGGRSAVSSLSPGGAGGGGCLVVRVAGKDRIHSQRRIL